MKKKFLKTAIALAVLSALPTAASAGLLTIRLTDSFSGTTYTCVDNAACDNNAAANAMTLDATAANAALGSSLYDINGITAGSNFVGGNPLLSIVTSSGGITSRSASQTVTPLILEISQTDWNKPVNSLRSLFQGPTAIFTNTGAGDFVLFHAINDAANALFAGNNAFDPPNTNASGLPATSADDFVTPVVKFDANVAANGCGPVAGSIQSCSDQSQLLGINEGNPYSMTQRIVFQLSAANGGAGAVNRVEFSDSISKFNPEGQVPEPASMLLVSAGLFGAWVVRRKKPEA